MPNSPTLMKSWGRMVLAIVLAVGGFQGLWVLRPAFWNQQNWIATAFVAFFLGNVAAGLLLWKKPRWGLLLTLVLQLFQLLRIEGPTLSYTLANFAGVWVMSGDAGADLPLNVGSCFQYSRITGFGPSIPTGSTYWGVNLFAIGVMIAVWLLWPGDRAVDKGPVR